MMAFINDDERKVLKKNSSVSFVHTSKKKLKKKHSTFKLVNRTAVGMPFLGHHMGIALFHFLRGKGNYPFHLYIQNLMYINHETIAVRYYPHLTDEFWKSL